MDNEPVERCDNCLKDFPESKIATHFGYCRRNIKKCPVCQEMFDINFKEDHQEEYHKKEKCKHCAKEFSISDYKDHEKKCEHKPKFCEYCQLNVPVATFPSHYAACQSRTKPCSKCNKPIMNKDYLIHSISCDGVVVVQPKKPANYQQYLYQNQKRNEEPVIKNPAQRISSRDKPVAVRPREQNIKYAQIGNRRQDVRVYQPRIINQPRIVHPPRQQLNKREYVNYPPQHNQVSRPEVKRQQPPAQKRIAGSINSINVPKKQDSKSIGIKPVALSNEQIRRSNGSRQAVGPPVSNKDIFPQQQLIKDSKSSDKNGRYIKRQEDPRIKYGVPTNIRPEQIRKPIVQVIPRQKEQIVRKKSPEVKQQYVNHHELGQFGLSPEEQMMQEILMQSANQHKSKIRVPPTNQGKTVPKNEIKDVPYLEGQDFLNESFIEKQRAIEQELARKKGRR